MAFVLLITDNVTTIRLSVLDTIAGILFSIIALFNVESVPTDLNGWQIQKVWSEKNNIWFFSASNNSIASSCENGKSILFPQVIHGVHKIYIDDELVIQTSDLEFRKAASFYARPSLSCNYLKKKSTIKWEVVTYAKFFARIEQFPTVELSSKYTELYFFDVLLNVITGVCLIIVSLLALFLFLGKIASKYLLNLFFGGIAFSVYSILVSADVFGFTISMLTAHKIADIAVWLGPAFLFYFFMEIGFLNRFLYYAFIAIVGVSITIIALGETADQVQTGTVLPIPIAFVVLLCFVVLAFFRAWKNGIDRNVGWGIVFAIVFAVTGINDLMHIFGIINSVMIAPIGFISGCFFAAAVVNQSIEKVYAEKDKLAIDARERTVSLQVAHDIRSPISVLNLLKPTLSSVLSEDQALLLQQTIARISDIADDLLQRSRERISSNFSIIQALTEITEEKKFEFKERKSIAFQCEIEKSTAVTKLSQKDLKRVISNLINNSVTALESKDEGTIVIIFRVFKQNIQIQVQDNGCGIPAEIVNKLGEFGYSFQKTDGHGLGLFHAKAVIESVGGRMEISSKQKLGTSVSLIVPRVD